MSDKIIKVVGAAILKDDRIFVAQRGKQMLLADLWEFPGGKLESGESEEEAIIREIKEEFNSEIRVLDYIDKASYQYSFGHVHLSLYTAQLVSGDLEMIEHQAIQWLEKEELKEIDWAPVDIPLAESLYNRMK